LVLSSQYADVAHSPRSSRYRGWQSSPRSVSIAGSPIVLQVSILILRSNFGK
jgi:hypothetical protein